MTLVQQTYINALLADATYADNLRGGDFGATLEGRLSSRMTPTLAKFIGDNFEVASHAESNDVVASGFDATVWRGRAGTPYAGKIYVSIQGTEGLQDFLTDVKLALTGNAGQQTIDMVNWWLQITAPAGSPTHQIGYTLDPATGYLSAASDVPGLGLVSAAELANGVEVNGHSLGGYLASAFTRLLGTQAHVTQTTTFNSAGFALGDDQLEGGDGADQIWADDKDRTRTPVTLGGNGFADGSAGDDKIVGGGKDDVLFGGAGNDQLYGDDRDPSNTPPAVNGNDYLDGEDGDDTLVSGGERNDTLHGGSGNICQSIGAFRLHHAAVCARVHQPRPRRALSARAASMRLLSRDRPWKWIDAALDVSIDGDLQ